jgi:hypothetical protein
MAIAAVRPRAHYERGFAHSHERRSPQAGVSSSVGATPVMNGTAPTAASNSQTALVPTNLKGLVGVIVVLGLFALGEHYIDLVLYLFSSKDSCDHLENHSLETPQNKCAFKLDYRTREANGFRNPH